jgi:cytoskeletal protein RodZ
MKTVGQLIHSARTRKNISIEELSLATKIDGKYIERIEADRYDLLPSETFVKGFIRNISLSLGIDPEELIAVFRRDFKGPDIKRTSPKKHGKLSLRFPQLSSQVFQITFGVVVFILYLVFQFRAILTPPPLNIDKPSNDSVLVSPVFIHGTTSTDCLVSINNDNVAKPDQNGVFQISINLPIGETAIQVKTTNRFGRSKTTSVPLTIISN